jgi:hypothetical protein
MKRAIIAAIFLITGTAHATQQMDVQAYHRLQALQGMEQEVMQCVFETVQNGMLIPGATVKSAIHFSSLMCSGALWLFLERAGVPQAQRKEEALKFVFPIIKLALVGLNPALIDGWPETLPEGTNNIGDLAK